MSSVLDPAVVGTAYHVGIAVHDLDRGMRDYAATLGVGPWAQTTTRNPAVFRGRRLEMGNRVAFARWGLGLVELVQPLDGDSPATEYLRLRGEGVYHVGYVVADIEAHAGEEFNRVWHDDHLVAVYLDTLGTLGMYVQLSPAAVANHTAAMVDAT